MNNSQLPFTTHHQFEILKMVGEHLTVAFGGECQSEESSIVGDVIGNQICTKDEDEGFTMVIKSKKTRDERFRDRQNRKGTNNPSSTALSLNISKERKIWNEHLEERNLKSRDCGGRGNCYACVIAHVVFNDATRHPEVRKGGIDHLVKNYKESISLRCRRPIKGFE